MSDFEDYQHQYETVNMEKEDGILTVRFNTDGEELVWNEIAHREFPQAFADIGADRENEVVVMTGTREAFYDDIDPSSWVAGGPEGWDKIYWEGKHLLRNLLNIEVPIIGAVKGPARHHAELAVLSDIVLAADTAVFSDKPYF